MDMTMRHDKNFLNFRVTEELMTAIDEAAAQNGWDRSKQVRAMLEAAFGMVRRPYIPVPTQDQQLSFSVPHRGAPGTILRRRRASSR